MPSMTETLTAAPNVVEAPWRPTSTYDGQRGEIASRPYPERLDLEDSAAIDKIITDAGFDPAQVMCVTHPKVSSWDVPNHGQMHAYKLELMPRTTSRAQVEQIIAGITPPEPVPPRRGRHWATVQIGDVHLGKHIDAGGGTERILARYRQTLANATAELQLLEPLGIEGVHLALVGDLIEGVVSQGGKNIALMDLSVTEQIIAAQRLVVQTARTFLDLGYQVKMSAIGGNHGDTQRTQGQALGDNHDIGIAIGAADRIADFPEYGDRFDYVIPPRDQSYMTFPVGDTTFTSVHGHQFSGSSAHQRAEKWWAGQSLSRMAAAGSDVLMAGHFHTFAHLNIAEGRTAVYSPSMEVMSRWFHERTGATSDRGAALYLTAGGAVSHMTIV